MVEGIMDTLHRRMSNINNWVATRKYLVGNNFTLADLTLASVLGHGYSKFFDKAWREKYPAAFEYFQRIIQEPRVKDAFADPPMTLVDTTPEYKPKAAQ
jgi:elongation factor 1-gamma